MTDHLGQLGGSLDAMSIEEQARLLRVLVTSGHCVHSVFVSDCNGCRERELRRALAALVEVRYDGFKTPIHGLVPNGEDDLWTFAKQVLEMTDV